MKLIFTLCYGLLLFAFGCQSQKKRITPAMEIKNPKGARVNSPLLNQLLLQYPAYFDSLLQQEQTRKIQVIYTKIDRDKNNLPSFTHYYYGVNANQYFYPASTVKMPVAALALQKINQLGIPGLNRNTKMLTNPAMEGKEKVIEDSSSANDLANIAQHIKKIFLVSDNEAFNSLYEFLGQEYINNSLHQMGYDKLQIIHRLNILLSEEQNRTTSPVRFIDATGKNVYQQSLQKSRLVYQPRNTFLGKGYVANDSIIYKPFDFSKKNRFTLPELHSVLQSLIFPESVPQRQRFQLTEDDHHFLWKYMSMHPAESNSPYYDSSYHDTYVKFLFYGTEKYPVDPSIRIFNKVGDAYGFLTDAAYIVDFKNNIEFLLSATISCNSDGIFNDDRYDYESTGWPFLKNLGRVIYEYELKRERKFLPDLSNFKIDYQN